MPAALPPPAGLMPRPGRSLLEMLGVLALLGVMASIIAPAMPDLRESADVRASRELVALLRNVRALAIDQRTTVTAILEPGTGRAWIVDEREHRLLATDSVSLGRGVELVAGVPRARFTFAPTGTASGAPLVIRSSVREYALRVDPWTGEPRVTRR